MRQTVESETLTIASTGLVERRTLELAAAAIDEHLPLTARIDHTEFLADGLPDRVTADGRHDQFDAIELARYITAETAGDRTLVVTDRTVSHGRQLSLFGIGIQYGRASLLSTSQLGGDRFEERVRKLAVSEVGYLLGLDTCANEQCPYTETETIEALDTADETPCQACRAELTAAGESEAMATDDELTGQKAAVSSVDSTDDPATERSTNAVTHQLISTARFWIAVTGYGIAFIVTLLALMGLLDGVAGIAVTDSDRVMWVLIAIAVVIAWFIYRTCRQVIAWIWRAGIDSIR